MSNQKQPPICDVCDTGFAMEQHDCPQRTIQKFEDTWMGELIRAILVAVGILATWYLIGDVVKPQFAPHWEFLYGWCASYVVTRMSLRGRSA